MLVCVLLTTDIARNIPPFVSLPSKAKQTMEAAMLETKLISGKHVWVRCDVLLKDLLLFVYKERLCHLRQRSMIKYKPC